MLLIQGLFSNEEIATFILSHVKITYRTRHNEIRLGIEVATKYVITMSFQRLQTFALWNEKLHWYTCTYIDCVKMVKKNSLPNIRGIGNIKALNYVNMFQLLQNTYTSNV